MCDRGHEELTQESKSQGSCPFPSTSWLRRRLPVLWDTGHRQTCADLPHEPSAPSPGHAPCYGWRTKQHLFYFIQVCRRSFLEQIKHSPSFPSALIFFCFYCQCMPWCYLHKPMQGHEHCPRTQKWILICFTAAVKLIREKCLTGSRIYTCTSNTWHISSPSP